MSYKSDTHLHALSFWFISSVISLSSVGLSKARKYAISWILTTPFDFILMKLWAVFIHLGSARQIASIFSSFSSIESSFDFVFFWDLSNVGDAFLTSRVGDAVMSSADCEVGLSITILTFGSFFLGWVASINFESLASVSAQVENKIISLIT